MKVKKKKKKKDEKKKKKNDDELQVQEMSSTGVKSHNIRVPILDMPPKIGGSETRTVFLCTPITT